MPTLTVFSDATDGMLRSNDATYANARAGTGTLAAFTADVSNSIGQDFFVPDSNFYCRQTFYAFDTSSIGSATIDQVDFSLFAVTDSSVQDFTLEVREHDWGAALTTADFVAGASLAALTRLATFATSGWTTSAYNLFTEDGTNFRSAIDPLGTTRVLVHSDRQRTNNAPVSGSTEYVSAYTADQTGTTNDPKLVVTYTPIAPTPVVGNSEGWRWAIGQSSGTAPEEALSRPKARRVTWRLRDSADAAFTMRGTDPQAGAVEELITDLWCYRDGALVYRGRVGPTEDDVGDVHNVSVTTGDYRAVLARRMLFDDSTLVFTADDQADIAWALIDDTQARTGGDLQIIEGAHGATGITRDRTFEAGQYVGQLVTQQLSEVIDGFDWEIDPYLTFNLFYPERGSDNGVVLDYGGIVASVRRTVDPSNYFNALRLSGADALTAETREAAGLGALPEGRWDRQIGEPSVLVQSSLDERADLLIVEGAVISPSYVVTLKANRWEGPDHIFVGDTVQLVVRSLPRLDVNVAQRVYEVSAAVDDDGKEVVQLTIGSSDTLRRRQLPSLSTRVADLERR